MKLPAAFVFTAILVVFSSFSAARDNQDTPPPSTTRQQKIVPPGQGQGGGMQSAKERKMMNMVMTGRNTMSDCSGCMMNRILTGSGNFYLDMRTSLGLTDAQVEKLQKIRLNHAKQTRDLQGELDIARLELRDLLEKDTIQINDADWKISDTYDLEAELQLYRVKSMIRARNVLTPSQREQAKSLASRGMMLPVMGGGREQRR